MFLEEGSAKADTQPTADGANTYGQLLLHLPSGRGQVFCTRAQPLGISDNDEQGVLCGGTLVSMDGRRRQRDWDKPLAVKSPGQMLVSFRLQWPN